MVAKKKDEKEVTLGDLDLLARAVANEYAGDPCSAGVTISLLPGGDYYASVLRYRERFGEGKFVVCSAREASLEDAVCSLGKQWLSRREAKKELVNRMQVVGNSFERAFAESLGVTGRKWGR